MVATPTKPITLEQFLALPETKPASEYIAGKIVSKPMPQGKHSLLQLELIFFINSILRKTGGCDRISRIKMYFWRAIDLPDVVVLRNENIPKDDNGEIANIVTMAPDWVIEILSPDQSTTKVIANIVHCLDNGTQVGWLIDPAEKMIMIYRPDRQVEIIDNLERELIVPEFAQSIKLTAGEIFDWLKLT
ncbi:MAG: Uma2 family endonuclease [Chamaesiphon sp. CSU_1_12]|nr:Uma2 family endonuclease [Chamaesiphon sp. CSU_1_12]